MALEEQDQGAGANHAWVYRSGRKENDRAQTGGTSGRWFRNFEMKKFCLGMLLL